MIDIVYLAKGRPEFTKASLDALARNTNWKLVQRLIIYTDGTKEIETPIPFFVVLFNKGLHEDSVIFRPHPVGGPINIMLDAIESGISAVWAKIDNDVIVPPCWLHRAARVMRNHDELSFLGLEPPLSRTPAPWANGRRIPSPEDRYEGDGVLTYAPCDAIGGIGLMRTKAFAECDMRQHSTYGGFTDWQLRRKDLVKGWILPPINLFLLDRLPVEPWASLSKQYITAGEQRPWTNYDPADHRLWDWWIK